jgi:hypothetical protein
MAGELQPLAQNFKVVDENGFPTLYFIKWAQQRQIDISEGITLVDLQAYLTAHALREGSGIQFTPSGDLNDSPLIAADVQEILDQISATRGTLLYRGLLGWAALAPGTAGQLLQANGAGTDPTWVAPPSGGGGALALIQEVVTAALQASVTFSAIPSTYRDLVVAIRGRGTVAASNTTVLMQFNADTANNYDFEDAHWFGAGTNFTQTPATTSIVLGFLAGATAPAGNASGFSGEIFDYRGTTFFKEVLATHTAMLGTAANTIGGGIFHGQWRSTAAINALKVFLTSGAFANNSVVSLYGRM